MTFELDLKEGKFLVALARRAVKEYLEAKKKISIPKDAPKKLLEPCGIFVTLNIVKDGEKHLRGCIGYPYPTVPLVQAVIESAISSATQDPRFYPLSRDELDDVLFEVSVLTPPELVEVKKPSEYPLNIKVGKDGLIVEKGAFKGLLLPQVPVECEWNEEEFLCQCCIKAYLPPDNWLVEGTKIYKFQAIIFEEEKPGGKVKQKALGGK